MSAPDKPEIADKVEKFAVARVTGLDAGGRRLQFVGLAIAFNEQFEGRRFLVALLNHRAAGVEDSVVRDRWSFDAETAVVDLRELLHQQARRLTNPKLNLDRVQEFTERDAVVALANVSVPIWHLESVAGPHLVQPPPPASELPLLRTG